MMDALPAEKCSECSTASLLLSCTKCTARFCSVHTIDHISKENHSAFAIHHEGNSGGEPLRCILCRGCDLRSLAVSTSETGQAVLLCIKRCSLLLKGSRFPTDNASPVLDKASVHSALFEKKLLTAIPPVEVGYVVVGEKRRCYESTILKPIVTQRKKETVERPKATALLERLKETATVERQKDSELFERLKETATVERLKNTAIVERLKETATVGRLKGTAVAERLKETAVLERLKESKTIKSVPTPQSEAGTSPSSPPNEEIKNTPKRSAQEGKKGRKADESPVKKQAREGDVPNRSKQSPSAVLPPTPQSYANEEIKTQNVIPDVFEDELQYLEIFTDMLDLEVREERKQMEYMRTQASIRWLRDQKVVGEVVLESIEELSHGDDLKVTDESGNSAIVTINEIDAENAWVNFKGDVQNLYIDYAEDAPHEDDNETGYSEIVPNHVYTIEFWESGSIKRMKSGLQVFYKGTAVSPNTASWLLGLERPVVNATKQAIQKPEGVKLNRYQEEAIQYALANELALIQGPPGTGKTATAAVVVYNMYTMVREQVLVCAPSNIAVDQLSLNISKFSDIKVLRIYGKNRIKQGGILPAESISLHLKVRQYLKNKYPNIGDAFLDMDIPVEKTMAASKVHEDLLAIEQDLIEEHNVIACTCAMSTSKKLQGRRFKYLLVDEAGFSAEPETLLPILKGCEHFVLVGDHMQLPPVVKSRLALKCRYGRSMFERLIDIGIQAKMLQLQYRMHPALSAFPSREFYGGKLRDGIEAKDRILKQLRDYWPAKKPMLFLDVAGLEEIYGKSHSYCNQEEAELLEHLLYELLQSEVAPTSIGVITPYEGQRRRITEYIVERGRCDIEEIEIKNIDGFQGREKDLILISCVRSNSDSEIGFLTESRRLNVAITRAKYGLIMVGNARVLRSGKFWQGLLEEFRRNRCVLDGNSLLEENRLA